MPIIFFLQNIPILKNLTPQNKSQTIKKHCTALPLKVQFASFFILKFKLLLFIAKSRFLGRLQPQCDRNCGRISCICLQIPAITRTRWKLRPQFKNLGKLQCLAVIEWRSYLDNDPVGIGKWVPFSGINNTVLSHTHRVGLNVFWNALGVTRLKLEPHRIRDATHKCKSEKCEGTNQIERCRHGVFSIWGNFGIRGTD